MPQLPLALQIHRHAALDNFVGGDQQPVVDHIRAVARGTRGEFVWLTGPLHTGKSHLLAAACRAASEAGRRAMYLPLAEVTEPKLLGDVDSVDLLALDDLQAVAGDRAWENGLFAAINGRLERGGLLMAADSSPRECGFALPDLVSRVSAASVYRLAPLSDDGLRQAVTVQAAERGLELDDAAASYLLQRVNRDPGELMAWLDRIDRYALAAQRRITIPLLRQVIAAANAEAG